VKNSHEKKTSLSDVPTILNICCLIPLHECS
jgi:hypothetical protein